MRSCSGPESTTDYPSVTAAVPGEQKPRKRRRAFCLTRMKPRNSSSAQQQHQPAANNNNMPFMIHCQIGKEIKHICSNCRGAEPLDGEDPVRLDRVRAGGGGGGGVRPPSFKGLLSSICRWPLPACGANLLYSPGAALRSAPSINCIYFQLTFKGKHSSFWKTCCFFIVWITGLGGLDGMELLWSMFPDLVGLCCVCVCVCVCACVCVCVCLRVCVVEFWFHAPLL